MDAKTHQSRGVDYSMYGEHWRPRDVIGDLAEFRNNGISAGFDGYSWVKHKGGVKEIAKDGVLLAYDLTRAIVGEDFFRKLYFTGIGNPPYIEHDGYKLTSTDIIAVYNAWQLCRWFGPPEHIVEIGPGFGALTAYLRRIYPKAKITLIDLPERHAVLRYYLENTVGLDNITITTDLPQDCDLVIALRCLMEMPPEEIKRYINWMQACPSMQYFYTINRTLKYYKLPFKFYPFDRKWIPLVSQPDLPSEKMQELILKRVDFEDDLLPLTMETWPPFRVGDRIYDQTSNWVITPIKEN